VTQRDWLFWLVTVIAIGTVTAGLGQLALPRVVLFLVDGSPTLDAAYFFAIIGMFMALFGGMMLHTLFSSAPHPTILLWASLQKLGASLAVGLGVLGGHFGPLAYAVAGFDLFSGIVMLMYRTRLTASPLAI